MLPLMNAPRKQLTYIHVITEKSNALIYNCIEIKIDITVYSNRILGTF